MNPKFLIAVVLTAGLVACAQKPQTQSLEIEELPGIEAQTLLNDAQSAIEDGQFRNADPLLQQLQQRPLNTNEQLQLDLLMLELALQRKSVANAKAVLDTIDQPTLRNSPEDQQIRYGLLKAQYFELNGNYLTAARERDFLSGILQGDVKQQNHQAIWSNLLSLEMESLLKWAEQAANTQFAQWLQLAAIAKDPAYTLEEHLTAVQQWRQAHPAHPASVELPGGLSLLEEIAREQPKHIALLLPLTGSLANSGKAVRDGFMAAYYQTLQRGYQVPEISIIDTEAAGSMELAYGDAIALGAEWAVGPLNKKSVSELAQLEQLPLPTLALNYADEADLSETPDELYQFGLAAEDEAILIAEQAYQQGHRRVLAFLPDNAWGQRIYQAFESRWLELGGEIAEQRFYQQQKDYNPEIKALLNVDDSQKRYKTVRRLMRESMEFEPRRRQDVDWVFMVALPKQGRQIRPMFDFNFAGDLPVYSTSHIFSGTANRKKDNDLNGIYFTDLPWLLENPELKQQVEKSQKQARGAYSRLYAMGVDAFRLYPRLTQLSAFPNSKIFGVTGALSMDQQHKIHRQTRFARFRAGRPVPITLSKD
jgi:outer membrane PBP1 activator LpoA protein